MRRSIAIIAAAAIYAAAPAAAETTGFCDGKVGGAYPVPGDAACTSDYYMCSWDGAMDAVARSCPDGSKWLSRGGWDFYCAAEASVPACEPSSLIGFCDGKTDGTFPHPDEPACATRYAKCNWDGAVDAVEEVCPAGSHVTVGAGTGNWLLVCEADISLVPECAAPAVVVPEGYCTGVTGSGFFADPNMDPASTCSNTHWKCNWEGATDAVVGSCPDGLAAKFNSATPTWNLECVDPSTITGCSL